MVLPVNTMTAGEALNIASMATARGAETRRTMIDTLQKSREAQEWASKEQTAMRRAQAEAAASEAKAQKLQMDIINENPDLVRQAYNSGQMAKISENFKTKSDNDLDSLALYFGDAKTAEDIEGGIKAALADGRADLVAKIPPIEAMKQDPSLVAQFRLQTSAALRERAFRQKAAMADIEGDIRSRQIQEQGGVESRLITQRGGIQAALQNDEQAFRRGMQETEFGQKRELMRLGSQYDKELATLKMQNDLEIQKMKASAEAGANFPKLKDVLGESADSYKKNTAPKLVAIVAKELGVDIDEQTIEQIGAEAANEVFARYADAQLTGAKISNPTEMVQARIRYELLSGRVQPKTSFWNMDFGQQVVPGTAANRAMVDAVSGITPEMSDEEKNKIRSSEAYQTTVNLMTGLMEDEEFAKMGIMDRQKVLQGLIKKGAK